MARRRSQHHQSLQAPPDAAPAPREPGLAPVAATELAPRTALGLLLALLAVSAALRLLWLDQPLGALIFDERFYVTAARRILGLPWLEGDRWAYHPAGIDPNLEHPPGGKLLLAASIRLLGDTAWGWRLPAVLFGTGAIALVFGIARRAQATRRVALVAAFPFAFDSLAFVHGRIANLDVFLVAFQLLGLFAFLGGRPLLAGLAIGAAGLCKLNGLAGLGVLALLEGLRVWRERAERAPRGGGPGAASTSGGGDSRGAAILRRLLPLASSAAAALATFLAGLWLLDRNFGIYRNPLEHLWYMTTHLSATYSFLTQVGNTLVSKPWQWLLGEGAIDYLVAGDVAFRGAFNPAVLFAAVPAAAWAVRAALRRRDDLSFLVLAIWGATFLPLCLATFHSNRLSYVYYFLPTLPAVALGAADLSEQPLVPRALAWAWLLAILFGFAAGFPFRGLP